MHTNIVAEIGSWNDGSEATQIIDRTADCDGIGVVVKGTQGDRWLYPYLDSAYTDATGAGLLVGHLHFCEPGSSTPEDEAVHIIRALRGRVYGLGVWLEVGELFGLQDYEAAPWVNTLAACVADTGRRVAVVATPSRFESLAGLDASIRRVVWGSDHDALAGAWAINDGDQLDISVDAVVYRLASIRGLNPVESHSPTLPVTAPDEDGDDDGDETEETETTTDTPDHELAAA